MRPTFERREILDALTSGSPLACYGVTGRGINDAELVGDPTGDRLDALLCAVQAAWAWRNRSHLFEVSDGVEPHEGWFADPGAV